MIIRSVGRRNFEIVPQDGCFDMMSCARCLLTVFKSCNQMPPPNNQVQITPKALPNYTSRELSY